ncbi:HAD family hydrolase [Facklamia hominis]
MKTYYLFDLDGTLLDPGIGITEGVRYALKHFGIEVAERSQLYPFIGPPLLDSFQEFMGLSLQEARQAIRFYRDYYQDQGMYENTVYPAIPRVLANLKDQGKTLALATSKPEYFAQKILDHYELAHYFDFIGGATLDEGRSNKSEVIQYSLQHLDNPDVNQVVMIGDRKFDILAGKEIGLTTIGVLYGYGSKQELQEAGADYLISQPEELLEWQGKVDK